MRRPTTSMTGKTCLVTGANSGIGRAIARELAARGSRVLMVARSRERGEAARSRLSSLTKNRNIELLVCDLASQRQVRDLAATVVERYDRLDVLVNNAGVILNQRTLTEDGVETTFAVNHLAPFLLTNLVLKRMKESEPSRIVTVASGVHHGGAIDFDDPSAERGYSAWKAYSQSKLANILFTRELARRLRGTAVTATCLHPGMVRTGFCRQGPDSFFFRNWFGRLLLLSPKKGADTAIWLATSPELSGASGGYYKKRLLVHPSRTACDQETAHRLWRLSERLTGL